MTGMSYPAGKVLPGTPTFPGIFAFGVAVAPVEIAARSTRSRGGGERVAGPRIRRGAKQSSSHGAQSLSATGGMSRGSWDGAEQRGDDEMGPASAIVNAPA